MKEILYNLVKVLVKTTLYGTHKKVEVYGLSNIPKNKPVLLLPNHQSALIDVLQIAVQCNRKPYFLTRADVFGKPLLNSIFNFFRMIPIYRIRDGRNSLSKNEAIFNTCAQILGKGEALVMFPEANHSLVRRVRPLSRGFTRVLFRAMEMYPDLDIHIIPVGLNYKNAEEFPDKMSIYYGEPILLNQYYDNNDLINTSNILRSKVRRALEKLTTHIPVEEDYDMLIEQLENKGVNYLKPKEVNSSAKQIIESLNYSTPLQTVNKKPKSLFYFLFLALNFPIIGLWRMFIKPKVREAEFIGTFRFATILVSFPIYLIFLFIVLLILFNVQLATIVLLGLIGFNLMYVKLG